MKKFALLSAVIAAVVATNVHATLVSQNGAGGTLNAQTPTITSDIVITDELFITDITVCLNGLKHVWAGDVDVTLTHLESNTSITIFKKIIGGTFGTSEDFDGNYNFNDSHTDSIWAAVGLPGTVIPGGNYYAVDGANLKQFFSIFNGLNSAGTWRLSVVDTFPSADHGSLESWTLKIEGTPVPAPAAVALLGLAGLAGARRRRA